MECRGPSSTDPTVLIIRRLILKIDELNDNDIKLIHDPASKMFSATCFDRMNWKKTKVNMNTSCSEAIS